MAFKLGVEGEADLRGIYSDPLPEVAACLQTYTTYDAVLENLPDAPERLLTAFKQ